MSYSATELENLSKLLLSVNDANVDLAFILIEQGGTSKVLLTELFAIYKLGNRTHRYKAKELLLECVEEVKGLLHIINRGSYLDGSSPRKKIKSFAGDCPDLDPMKLAMALYNKYGEGLQYLVSELPEEALKNLLMNHLQGTTFALIGKKITKIPPYIFKDYTLIENLNLANNQIKTLPAGIGKLTNLKVINLSQNKLTKINKAIGKLRELEELHLSYNNLKEIPAELGQLSNLKILMLDYISATDFPLGIIELPNLEELTLTYSSYSPSPIDEAFFNLKTNKLIRLRFDSSSGQTRWTNLPAFSEVTGTYEDPIDTHPLALARRAYVQNKECVAFLLEHAPLEEIHALLQEHISGHTLSLETMRVNRLPQALLDYDIKEWRGNGLKLLTEDIWEDLKYMPNVEVIDLGMSTGANFWGGAVFPIQILQTLKQLRVLNVGTIDFRNIVDAIVTLQSLEELWIYEYLSISSTEELHELDKFKVLKELPHLKKFYLRGISNNYWNEPEKARAIKEAVAQYISQWLPNGCEVVAGANDVSQF
ncbi:MAG: leucine-rich repeat domain-containing protein [Aureispira sp.]